MILGMSQLSVRQDIAVVWLLYYRLFYYVIPFATGLLLFLTQTGVKVNRFLDNIPRLVFQKLAHLVLVSAVYFAGIMMVLLSTITNLSTISRLFQFYCHFHLTFRSDAESVSWILIIRIGTGFSDESEEGIFTNDRVTCFGIINTVTRTLSWQLIVVYLLILLVVWLSRKEFYRQKFVYSWGAIVFDACLFGFLFIVYAIAGYHSGSFWVGRLTANHFILFPSDDVWFSGLIGLGISLLALVALYQYLATTPKKLGESFANRAIGKALARYGGTAASHYLRLPGYTYFYYQKHHEDQVVFGFQIKGNKCFILGDPIGNPERVREATAEFMKKPIV